MAGRVFDCEENMTQHFFITSSGTNVGKTYVTALLAQQLRAQGKTVAALKPIISGYDAADAFSDTAQLMAATACHDVDAVSPYRFKAPLAPNMAAAREGKNLSLAELTAFCQQPRNVDVVLVEGVGGVMVPLNEKDTTLDWMVALNYPVIIVVGSYLGAISHALSACEVLRARGLVIQAVIISESEDSSVDFHESCLTMQQFLDYVTLVVSLPRAKTPADLTGILL
jgi:dethiobiotin synthetase